VIYTPDLSAGITESFFQHIERLAQPGTSILIKKRLTEISIELLQNIQKHSVDIQTSCLTIEKANAQYSIRAVNRIHAKDVKALTDRIDTINEFDQSELKGVHRKALSKAILTEKGGAGLGLYKIALRSNSRLLYAFEKINTSRYSFSFEINLTTHA
jgi:Family of unknown function (DUF6272)